MPDKKKIDWEAAYAMQDKEKMFLLYAVSDGLCRHINDFSQHFEGSVKKEVQELVMAGFLEESFGRLDVTARGRFVLGDLAGDKINEEKRVEINRGAWVISNSPRHADNGIGVVQEVQGERAKVEFRPTIFSNPPYETVSRILSINALRVIKDPIERLIDSEFDELWRFELRMRAAQLLFYNQDGQLGNGRTDLLPHQISVAHKVVFSPRPRYLIADEVGLGKTVETGMILYALKQRGQAQRVLIVPPAGLTLQWQEEMDDKFGLKFDVYRKDVDWARAFQMDYLIASLDTLKRKDHKTRLLESRDWDVIVFDEAHKLSAKTWSQRKTEKTLSYRLAEDLQKQERYRALILLTATPHQGDESKFQKLVTLLHSNVTFEEPSIASQGNGAVHFTDLIIRNRKSKVTDAEGKPIFKGMDIHPVRVALLDNGEKQFHKKLELYLREGYGFADQDRGDTRHKAIGFVMTTFQKLAASSTMAIKSALKKRVANLLQAKESENGDETEYDERHEGEFEAHKAEQDRGAFIETEVEMLEKLLDLEVPGDAKRDELYEAINSVIAASPDQQILILIFTEYLATQNFLVELLEKVYGEGCAAIIRGGMSTEEKKESIAQFRDGKISKKKKTFLVSKKKKKVRFLVSTEAGGEGINLQFAHVMINYDLPWNPFRLAQRYGRLYRYGQDKPVQVFNFQNEGTIEDKVRKCLEQKTDDAAARLSKVTGESIEEIKEGLLGQLEEHLNYEKIYRDGLAKGDIKPSQEEIDMAFEKAEKSYKIAYDSLFSKNIAPFNPERFKDEVASPLTLEHVKAFILEFIKREKRKVTPSDDGTLEFLLPECLQPKCLKGVEGLKPHYEKVTFDRAAAIRNSQLEFMAIGHPFTNAVLKRCGSGYFGGLAGLKGVRGSSLISDSGVLFNFSVKVSKEPQDDKSTFFKFIRVFVHDDKTFGSKETVQAVVEARAVSTRKTLPSMNAKDLFKRAKEQAFAECAPYEPWPEDVFCLSALRVEVV